MSIKIVDPPKSWWPGDDRVEKFMPPVAAAIKRHVKWPSDEYTDIYNRAYEAVYAAIQASETERQLTPGEADTCYKSVSGKHTFVVIGSDTICASCGKCRLP